MSGSAAAQDSDYDVVQSFAAANPEVYGGVWFVGPQLNVGLTVMRPHAKVLRALLRDPGAVTIRPVRFTTAEVAAVAAELELLVRESGTTWHSLGARVQVATADLGPEGSTLASELHHRFGDRIRVTVGGRAYPPDGTPVPTAPAPAATRKFPGLQLRAVLREARVPTGSALDGQVQLLNAGRTPIRFDTDQPLVAVVIDAGRVVGTYSGWSAGTGLMVDLAPGAAREISFTGGTAGGSGEQYSTPPGSYTVIVSVPIRSPPFGELVTPPVPLEVTSGPAQPPT